MEACVENGGLPGPEEEGGAVVALAESSFVDVEGLAAAVVAEGLNWSRISEAHQRHYTLIVT